MWRRLVTCLLLLNICALIPLHTHLVTELDEARSYHITSSRSLDLIWSRYGRDLWNITQKTFDGCRVQNSSAKALPPWPKICSRIAFRVWSESASMSSPGLRDSDGEWSARSRDWVWALGVIGTTTSSQPLPTPDYFHFVRSLLSQGARRSATSDDPAVPNHMEDVGHAIAHFLVVPPLSPSLADLWSSHWYGLSLWLCLHTHATVSVRVRKCFINAMP